MYSALVTISLILMLKFVILEFCITNLNMWYESYSHCPSLTRRLKEYIVDPDLLEDSVVVSISLEFRLNSRSQKYLFREMNSLESVRYWSEVTNFLRHEFFKRFTSLNNRKILIVSQKNRFFKKYILLNNINILIFFKKVYIIK